MTRAEEVVKQLRDWQWRAEGTWAFQLIGDAADLLESQSREIESLGRLVDWYQEQYPELVAKVERQSREIKKAAAKNAFASLPHDEEQHQPEGETTSDGGKQDGGKIKWE